jgi:hypothetical protein
VKYSNRHRKESGLGSAQQEADDGEGHRTRDQGGQAGDDAPADHDPGNPQPSADFFQDHIAGHLEYEIAPEERAGRESEGSDGHVEISPHRQSGEAHVDPINVRQNVRQDRERQQAHVDLAHGRFFHCAVHLFLLCFHL